MIFLAAAMVIPGSGAGAVCAVVCSVAGDVLVGNRSGS